MEDISHIISDLKYKKYNTTRIALELLKKGYSEKEIKIALLENKLKRKNNNQIIAIILIVIGVLANFYTESTYINNFFRFDFFSQADFMLFNERILKPTITISMIFLGINLLIERTRINKFLKYTLIILLIIFGLTITSYYSILAILFCGISLLVITLLELPEKIKTPELQKIFPEFNRNWNGTAGYTFLVLGIVLVYSSEISFKYIETGEKTLKASLGFIDHFILQLKPIFGILGLLTALLMSISLNKFKIALYILAGFTVIFILACLLHSEFQNLIYGCSIILITSILIYFTHRNRKTNAKKTFANNA